MKKIISLVLVLFVICSIFSMSGCSHDTTTTTTTAKAKTMTLVVGAESPTIYLVELDGLETDNGIMPILKHLKETKGLDYATKTTSDGVFLTRVGDVKQIDELQAYVYIFSTVEKDRDITENSRTVRFEGKQIFSAGVSADKLTIEDGCTIYIGIVHK